MRSLLQEIITTSKHRRQPFVTKYINMHSFIRYLISKIPELDMEAAYSLLDFISTLFARFESTFVFISSYHM